MGYGRKAPGPRGRGQRPHALRHINYDRLAEDLVFEMAERVHSQDTREFCAPFELVIIDPHGAVVFRCEIGEDWQVRHNGPSRIVQRNHFPAMALLTDRSLLTRTFQIDRARD